MLAILAQNWWAVALRGVIAILFGVLAIALPGVTLAALILLWGVYAVADGVFAIISGVRAARRHERWGVMVVEGIAGIIAGLIAVFLPAAAAFAFVFLFALWAVVTGVIEIVAAVRLRREIQGEWLLALAGALSVLLGIYVVAFPELGVLGLIWTLGLYAILFGIALIALSLRLRHIAASQARLAHS